MEELHNDNTENINTEKNIGNKEVIETPASEYSYEEIKTEPKTKPKPDYTYQDTHYQTPPPVQNNAYTRKRRTENPQKSGFGDIIKVGVFAAVMGLSCGLALGAFSIIKEQTHPSSQQKIETTVSDTSQKPEETKEKTTPATSETKDVSDIVEDVLPSVVSITGKYKINNIFGFTAGEAVGAGSGFIIAEKGDDLYIATNNHIVEDSSSLSVGFVNDTSAKAEVVGKDTDADLAVIKVNKKDLADDTLKAIKIATLGDSNSLRLGQQVMVIGNAMGYGQSVTTGVVSAKDREISFSDGTLNLIQTDAPINPGNSGGVLINTKGEVVGISNSKLTSTDIEGMGYAIPISTANSILNDIMNSGDVSSEDAGFLGVVGQDIDNTYSAALGIPKGIYITQLIKDSPAEKSGLYAGDVIVKIDDNTAMTMNGLKEKISRKKAGSEITITVKRLNQSGEYEEKEFKVVLAKASDFNTNEILQQQQQETTDQNNNQINQAPDQNQMPSDIDQYFQYNNPENSTENLEDIFFDFSK